ncbi:MAG: PRC-barrel domain-containing protein [Candidatus Saccharimonadaceae bacterium]
MLIIGSRLINAPVMSLQTGSEIARTEREIIDTANLKVIGYELKGRLLDKHNLLLRVDEIREVSDIGMIIDSQDELIATGDVIKFDEIREKGFTIIDMPVRDEKGSKLGKVSDYTLDIGSFIVQQLTVRRPMLKSLNDVELIIHRSQIIEINNKAIVVKSKAEVKDQVYAASPGAYVNPFRKSEPVASSADLAHP